MKAAVKPEQWQNGYQLESKKGRWFPKVPYEQRCHQDNQYPQPKQHLKSRHCLQPHCDTGCSHTDRQYTPFEPHWVARYHQQYNPTPTPRDHRPSSVILPEGVAQLGNEAQLPWQDRTHQTHVDQWRGLVNFSHSVHRQYWKYRIHTHPLGTFVITKVT